MLRRLYAMMWTKTSPYLADFTSILCLRLRMLRLHSKRVNVRTFKKFFNKK